MIRSIISVMAICLGLSACYLGESGSQLWKDIQDRAAEEAAKSK